MKMENLFVHWNMETGRRIIYDSLFVEKCLNVVSVSKPIKHNSSALNYTFFVSASEQAGKKLLWSRNTYVGERQKERAEKIQRNRNNSL
jgi:hypothetical protein